VFEECEFGVEGGRGTRPAAWREYGGVVEGGQDRRTLLVGTEIFVALIQMAFDGCKRLRRVAAEVVGDEAEEAADKVFVECVLMSGQ